MKNYITQLGGVTLLILMLLGTTSISVSAQHAHPPKDPYNKPEVWSKIEESPHQMGLWTEYMGKSWQELSYNERLKIKMWIQDMWLNQLSTKNALIAVIEDENEEEVVETAVVEEEVKEALVENTVVKEQKDEFIETVVEGEEENNEEVITIEETNVKNEIEETIEEVTKVEQDTKITEEEDLNETNTVETSKEVKTIALTTEKLTRKSLAFEVAERNPIYQKVLEKPKVRVFIKDLTEVVLAEPMDMVELKEDLFGNFLIIEDYYMESFAEYEIKYVYYAQKYPLGGYSEARWVSRHDQQLKALKAKRLNTLKLKFLDKQLTASTN